MDNRNLAMQIIYGTVQPHGRRWELVTTHANPKSIASPWTKDPNHAAATRHSKRLKTLHIKLLKPERPAYRLGM